MATNRLDGLTMPDGNDYDIPIFIAEYGTTPAAKIADAIAAGKLVFCLSSGYVLPYSYTMNGIYYFVKEDPYGDLQVISCDSADNSWNGTSKYGYASVPPSALPISSNQYLVTAISDSGAYITRSTIRFGSSTTKYLSENGTWQNIPTVPTKVSDLTNDSGFLTLADLPVWDGSVT